MATEAKHKGAHVILGPTTNIQRGPLGGRGFESFSEDPYLAGMASAAIVNGIQDNDIVATIKHFVGNDLEHERNASDLVVLERAFREIYLEPFRLAVKYASPQAFMTGYNKVNGTHVSQLKRIIDGILRQEWGFDGTVMSDWFGTYTTKEAIENGLDLEMPGPTTFRKADYLVHQVQTRELHQKHIDDRVRGVLQLIKNAAKLGIPQGAPENTDNNTKETRALLNRVASEAVVLLKNDGVLPLLASEKVAVIGPNAQILAYCGGGSAALRAYYTTTPFDLIAARVGYEPEYTVGAYAHRFLPGLGPQLVNPETGEPGYNLKFFKDPRSHKERVPFDEYNLDLSNVFLLDYYTDIAKDDLYYLEFLGDFTPPETADYDFSLAVLGTGQLFVNEKLVVDNKTHQVRGNLFFNSGSAEVRSSIHLEKGIKYRVRIDFGLAPTFTAVSSDLVSFGGGGGIYLGAAKVIDPKEEICKAVEVAKKADKVVLCIGLNLDWESEGFDRPDMALIGHTNELVEAVLAANRNTVVVNQSGTPVEMPWLSRAPALVHAWYGGNETGNAIASVLFGDVNPSGKLALSFPKKNSDNPAFLNFRTERGRVLYGEDIFVGYRYYEKLEREVAFPFGFGLSYTTFGVLDVRVAHSEKDDVLSVTATVSNTGTVAGAEVLQVYVSKDELDVIRPVKELKGFEKVHLRPALAQTVTLKLLLKDLVSFYDEYVDQWLVQKGAYKVHVGTSSDQIAGTAEFNIENLFFWLGL